MTKRKEESNQEKSIDIKKLLETTRKSFPNALITTGDDPDLKVKTIPSGIILLDNALKGGFRRGSLNEICGTFSTGKTWLVYHTIRQAQTLGLSCGLIDTEHRFDPDWAKNNIGVALANIPIVRTATLEDVFGIIYHWIDSGLDLIGVDSIASVTPKQLLDNVDFKDTIGLKARKLSEGLEKLAYKNKNTVILTTNQLRADIGNRWNPGILSKMVGGNRQYFDAASIIEVRRKGWLKEGSGDASEEDDDKTFKKIGFVMECVITKVNYSPTMTTSVKINYNFKTSQVDNILSIIDSAISYNLIKHSGPWYEYEGEKIQGRQGLRDYFVNNAEKFDILKEKILLP